MNPGRMDYALYLVTDRKLARGRSTLEVVRAAVRGGVSCVQLREKQCSIRTFIQEALSIRDFLKPSGVPLIINDRLDVALAVGADGVHLGQTDMPLEMARSIVKDALCIGISAESLEDARAAERGGADYIGVSPIFETATKADTAPALGLEGLRQIRAAVNVPLVAIGGLNRHNVGHVIHSGADGVAVVSAIVAAQDPEEASRDLLDVIQRARLPRGG